MKKREVLIALGSLLAAPALARATSSEDMISVKDLEPLIGRSTASVMRERCDYVVVCDEQINKEPLDQSQLYLDYFDMVNLYHDGGVTLLTK